MNRLPIRALNLHTDAEIYRCWRAWPQSDRTTANRCQRLGLEPKKKDWRPASMDNMPKRATKHFEKGRDLLKEAKGLR